MRIRILCLVLSLLAVLSCGCGSNGKETADETADPAATESQTAPETVPEETDTRLSVGFSVKGGVYDGAQTLELSLPENVPDGAYITYTDDCSEPDGKSKKYVSPLTVCDGKNSVIRAACFSREGEYLGYIRTATYVNAKADRFSTYIVSIVTEKTNLYGKTGIIDNPRATGKEWERPCHVEIMTANGVRVVSQDAGLRIFGGSSRGLPQKSSRLIARKDGYFDEMKYNGKGSFEYPFFDGRKIVAGADAGKPLGKYDRLVLRNFHNLPQVHDRDPVRNMPHHGKVMRDEEQRDPSFLLDIHQQVDNGGLNGHIQ